MAKEARIEDHPEFERLYSVYRNRVHAYCRRRASDVDAADAVSETFLVAWRRFVDLPAEPDTLAYLYGIAGRVLGNQRRATGRRKRLGKKLQALGVTTPSDPGTLILRNSGQLEVERAIRRLKPRDRELVMLDVWEELPRSQIADIMGMTRPAVNQRLSRTYKRLARTLDPSPEQSPISPSIVEKGGGV